MGTTDIAEVIAAHCDPRLQPATLQRSEIFIESGICSISRNDGVGTWIDGCKSIVQVGITGAVDFLRGDFVAQAVACVGALIVSDSSAVSGAAAEATSTALLHFARAEIFLTRESIALRIAVDTVEVGCLCIVSATLYIGRRGCLEEKSTLTPHQPVAEQHRFIPHLTFPPLLYLPHIAVASHFDVHFKRGHGSVII